MEKKNNYNICNISKEIIEDLVLLQSKNEILITEKMLNELLDNENNIYSVILAKNEINTIIGFAIIKNVVDFIDLEYILVDKNYRNMKIGKEILKNIYSYAKEKKVPKIILEVRESNTTAINFYENNDFKRISIRKNYYDKIEDALIYEYKVAI